MNRVELDVFRVDVANAGQRTLVELERVFEQRECGNRVLEEHINWAIHRVVSTSTECRLMLIVRARERRLPWIVERNSERSLDRNMYTASIS